MTAPKKHSRRWAYHYQSLESKDAFNELECNCSRFTTIVGRDRLGLKNDPGFPHLLARLLMSLRVSLTHCAVENSISRPLRNKTIHRRFKSTFQIPAEPTGGRPFWTPPEHPDGQSAPDCTADPLVTVKNRKVRLEFARKHLKAFPVVKKRFFVQMKPRLCYVLQGSDSKCRPETPGFKGFS